MDRHAFRAIWHDYNSGVYFVTMCSINKIRIFGTIHDNTMHLSPLGEIAKKCLDKITDHHPNCTILNHVIMPNHIHIVIAVGTRYIASATQNAHQTCTQPNPTTKQNKPQSIGCLKAPRHGEICADFHHNSTLATIIGSFKAAVTRLARTNDTALLTNNSAMQSRTNDPAMQSRTNDPAMQSRTRCIASLPIWQPRFHEHIIRDQRAYDNIMQYIDTNVSNWDKDCFK
ncbi:MAG: hypothetical protein NC421_11700 [Lachnospiraceae bacterium]|nr:hypothetical protein [Lachnospiraceae bacterium]